MKQKNSLLGSIGALVGAVIAVLAFVRGAWLNVLINVGSLKDKDLAAQYRRQGETVLKRAMELADQIDGAIMAVLGE